MKKAILKFTFMLLFLVIAINVATGQICNIIRNGSFDQGSPPIGSLVDGTGTNVPFWVAGGFWIGSTPDVYTGFKIFMWDQSGNPNTDPRLSHEYINQLLCESISETPTQPYNLSFSAATTTRGLGNGRLEVLLSDGANNVVVATIPNLTLTMTSYQFTNITSSIPIGLGSGFYDRIIIRPVVNVVGGTTTMDIIVDDIVLGHPVPVGTKYVRDVTCCQGNRLITYPGEVSGFEGLKWIDLATGAIVGNTPTITLTPNKSGIYLVQKSISSCEGDCTITDTVVLRCCGGVDDAKFLGAKYVFDVMCCQGSRQITYPGSMAGFEGLQWIEFSTGLIAGTTPTITTMPTKSGIAYLVQKSFISCGGNCKVIDTIIFRCCGGDNDWEFSNPNGITSADQIHRTGEVNIGNLSTAAGAPDIAKVEIKNNDNAKWNCFMLNAGGNGKMLRIKGGFYQGQHSIFQVEANGATDYTEDNVRLMVRADGRVGINTTTPRGTLDVNGSTWNTSGVWQTSDQRYKQNIEVIGNSTDILKNIKGYRYDFRTKQFPDRNFNEGRQIGFIAQELKQFVPEGVMQGDDGYLAVNYDMMVPILVEAYKELKTKMEVLKQSIITKLSTSEIAAANALQIACYPNPFSNNIEVKFNLASASAVSVKIINVEGKVVSKVEESRYEAGKQKLSINTQSLLSGSYMLLVDTGDGVYSYKIVCNR